VFYHFLDDKIKSNNVKKEQKNERGESGGGGQNNIKHVLLE